MPPACRPGPTRFFVNPAHPHHRRPPDAVCHASAVGDIATKHATAAGVRDDRRTAHALGHTFCTMLAERGVAPEVIRALAGHADISTTQIYVDVTNQRKADGIAALKRTPHPVGGCATNRGDTPLSVCRR